MGSTQSGATAVKMLKKIYAERIESDHKEAVARIEKEKGKKLAAELEAVFKAVDALIAKDFPWLQPQPKCHPHGLGYNRESVEFRYNIRNLPTKELEQFPKATKRLREKAEKNAKRLNDWEVTALKAVCSHEGLPEFEMEG